jgi:hypothetical protein
MTFQIKSPCSACQFQQGNKVRDKSKLSSCCVEICNSIPNKEKREACLKQCKRCGVDTSNDYQTVEPFFADCLVSAETAGDALGCCMKQCRRNNSCQQRCINIYNSGKDVPVIEGYEMDSRNYLVLLVGFVIVLYAWRKLK